MLGHQVTIIRTGDLPNVLGTLHNLTDIGVTFGCPTQSRSDAEKSGSCRWQRLSKSLTEELPPDDR